MIHPAPTGENTAVVIPARMQSTRLPGKPLADIAGLPMIVQVWRRAIEAGCGDVLVAVAEPEIAEAVEAAGGTAVLTDPQLPSGSDRAHQALQRRDPDGRYRYVINLQGDLPTLPPGDIVRCLEPLASGLAEISTLAARITDPAEVANPNVVKAIADLDGKREAVLADDFQRDVAAGARPPFWHHVGIYGYTRTALDTFVSLPVSQREKARRLEQMRALDNGMAIAILAIDAVPFGVDTPEDLDRARASFDNPPA